MVSGGLSLLLNFQLAAHDATLSTPECCPICTLARLQDERRCGAVLGTLVHRNPLEGFRIRRAQGPPH